MKSLQKCVVVIICALIAFSPLLAEARAGGSRSGGSQSHQSMGSRGSKTHDNNGSKPMERSMTQKSAPTTTTPPRQANSVPPQQAAPMAPQPTAQPSFFQRHPFMSGIAGGLVGSWIGSMLFNHSRGEASGVRDGNDWDAAASPAGNMLGSLIPFLLFAGLIMLGFWLYRRNAGQALASNTAGYNTLRSVPIQKNEAYSEGLDSAGPTTVSLPIGQSDLSAFTELLAGVQSAWGKANLLELKRLVTPEMLTYFSESLSNNASQGIENRIEQVTVLKQTVQDAWEEENLQYATALITWNALDYTIKLDRKQGDPDYVVEGDMHKPADTSETWTFVRSRGGRWLLSAIQQI